MDIYALPDSIIAEMVGKRLAKVRLRKNITQESVAKATMLSVNTIKAAEAGKVKLVTLIAILRELDVLEQIDQFIPEITISPIELASRKNKQRQRASMKKVIDEK